MQKKKKNKISKKKASKLWANGCAIIDTFGRTSSPKEKSIIALASTGGNFSVFYKAKLKKTIYGNKKPSQRLIAQVHCIGLKACLVNFIETGKPVFICGEGINRGHLKHYLQKILGKKYDEEQIVIMGSIKKLFGKKNPAHLHAADVANKRQKENLILGESHFKDIKKD